MNSAGARVLYCMTYKFEYEDGDHHKHVRYYHALDAATAKVMFDTSMEHNQGDNGKQIEGIHIIDVLKKEEDHWEHISIS